MLSTPSTFLGIRLVFFRSIFAGILALNTSIPSHGLESSLDCDDLQAWVEKKLTLLFWSQYQFVFLRQTRCGL